MIFSAYCYIFIILHPFRFKEGGFKFSSEDDIKNSTFGIKPTKILSDCATGKKHEHKVNKGKKSVMQTTDKQVTIVSELGNCVTRLKAQMCASTA